MPKDWVVADHISTLYEHIPSGRRFRAPLRVVVRCASSNIVYDKFVNLKAPGVPRWLPTASDHQLCLPENLLVDYLTAWRELDQLLHGKLVIVGDADIVLRELCYRVDNGHLVEVSRNSAVRDAFRHLTPTPFSKERLQQRTPLPLAQIFAAHGEGQSAVEYLHRCTRLLGRIYSSCRELDEFD